jgi:hypothetical protein
LAFLRYAAAVLVALVTLRLWWAWQSVQEGTLAPAFRVNALAPVLRASLVYSVVTTRLTNLTRRMTESLLVMRDLGVQVGTRYYSGRERKVFIERQRIESVIINEGIQTWAIFYYMAILVKGQERMVLPFEVQCCCSARHHSPARHVEPIGPLAHT